MSVSDLSPAAALVASAHWLFALRPTLEDTAERVLQDLFDMHYPGLGIAAAGVALLEPARQGGGYVYHHLTALLLDRCRARAPLSVAPASFLAYAGAEFPQRLAIPRDEILALIEAWAPRLLDCHQQQLVEFWSQPEDGGASPWLRLSDLLHENVRQACAGLADDERATVQAVLDYPDRGHRERALGSATTQAFISFIDGNGPADGSLVLSMTRRLGEREIALLYSFANGIERFESEAAMQASWFGKPRQADLTLRNYLSEHNLFDALALCLLERQLQLVAAIKPSAALDSAALEQQVARACSPDALLGPLRSAQATRLSALREVFPPWFKNAALTDRRAGSRLLSRLATVYRSGGSIMAGIPSLEEFAVQALNAQMVLDDPARAHIRPVDIEVTLQRVTHSGIEVIELPFTEPRYESERHAFVPMAIRNLEAFPPAADTRITYQGGEPPGWMTYEYLRELTQRADIGRHYPALLQRRLLDDPGEAADRQRQFCQRLGVLLPLLALELKIKGHLTDLAYRYVVAALQPDHAGRRVAGREVVVRPLAFLTHAEATADPVRNMFLIGPGDITQGPQLLYRPASSTALLEFTSAAGLLQAISRDGELQQSVLAGLTPVARSIYANGGFIEPHVARVIIDDFDIPWTPPPALLASSTLPGDFALALYEACATALIEQAARDSVSNAQTRWNRFKKFAWTLFNGALLLVDGPLAVIGLLTQLTISLDELARREGTDDAAQALADVLMGLALALVHTGGQLREGLESIRLGESQPGGARSATASAAIPLGNSLAKANGRAHPHGARARLAYGWSSPRQLFCARELLDLDTFKLPAPRVGQQRVASGEYQGLYQADSEWYAQVDGAWYRVSRKLEGVVIIDDAAPWRTGPWLERDGQGGWTLGYGPRLLGGSVGLSATALRKLKRLEKQAREQLAAFGERQAEARRLASSNTPSLDVQEIFIGKANAMDRQADDLAQLTQPLNEQAPLRLIGQLRAGAEQLRALGRTTRINMLKSRLPTVGAVDYLLQEGQVSIRKLGDRLDCSYGKGTDFLQEYAIRDTSNNRVLWYAHFHYPSKDTPPQAFSKAHLKTFAQRRRGLGTQIAQQRAGQAVQPIWRSDIGRVAAGKLFLGL